MGIYIQKINLKNYLYDYVFDLRKEFNNVIIFKIIIVIQNQLFFEESKIRNVKKTFLS